MKNEVVGVMAQDLVGSVYDGAVSEEMDFEDGLHLQVNYDELPAIILSL